MFILRMVVRYVLRVREQEIIDETTAGNKNVGYQGCNLKLVCISIDEIFEFQNAYGKLGDVKLVYVKKFVWFGRDPRHTLLRQIRPTENIW